MRNYLEAQHTTERGLGDAIPGDSFRRDTARVRLSLRFGALRGRAGRLRRSLPSRCKLFYAIKANSDESVLKALLNHTDGFEVASLGEIQRVRAIDD